MFKINKKLYKKRLYIYFLNLKLFKIFKYNQKIFY